MSVARLSMPPRAAACQRSGATLEAARPEAAHAQIPQTQNRS